MGLYCKVLSVFLLRGQYSVAGNMAERRDYENIQGTSCPPEESISAVIEMSTSHPEFNKSTTATEVADAFGKHIQNKNGKPDFFS